MKKNKIGLTTAVFMLFGAMFGSAIFSLSGLTIFNAGPSSLLSWIIAAPIMLIYGLLMSEMAGYYPQSGGVYVFPAKAIKGSQGKFWAWISCWGYILCNFAAIVFSGYYVGVYLCSTLSISMDFVVPISLISILFVFLLNIIKFKNTGLINNFLVAVLIIIMIVFIVCALSSGNFNFENFVPFFDQGASGNFGFVAMIPTCIIAYSSIVAIAFMASEIKNPKKNIARASIISIIVTAVMYVLILFSVLGYVSSYFISNNPDMMMVPLFAACRMINNVSWLPMLVGIASVISLLTTMLVIVSINSRAIKAAADDKILPSFFGAVSQNDQPIVGIIITVVVSSIVAVCPFDINDVVNFGILFNAITICIVLISVIKARKHQPKNYDGFVLGGGNFFPIAIMLLLVACYITSIFTANLFLVIISTVVFIALGVLIFEISAIRKAKSKQ